MGTSPTSSVATARRSLSLRSAILIRRAWPSTRGKATLSSPTLVRLSVLQCCIVHAPLNIIPHTLGRWYLQTPDELLKSDIIDAVLIATPHYSHTTIGVAALAAGLHVMVEKPISVHKEDCETLIAAYAAVLRLK